VAISVFPIADTGGIEAYSVATTTANIQKSVTIDLDPGIYQVSVSPTSSIGIIQFFNGSTYIGQTTTVSGIINFNLATAANRIMVQSNNVADVVTISLAANLVVSNTISGTLDTVSTSGTYNQTGLLWVLALGGGGGGGGGKNGYQAPSAGGASGVMSMFYGDVNTSTSITIGTGGNGSAPNVGGLAGTTTSFGTYAVAKGGDGGGLPNGTAGGVAAGTNSGTVVVASVGGGATQNHPYRAVKDGTTGGGGNCSGGQGAVAGGGSGIGTGGTESGRNGTSATGFAAGGGGAGTNNGHNPGTGGNGSGGVVYVLRGF
jgi:hypothetical protein